jgi:hypothetical protein
VKERILITVKTYPVLSLKYAELVCTAGVTESGEWRRLYPIKFRQLQDAQQYKKYQQLPEGSWGTPIDCKTLVGTQVGVSGQGRAP